MTIGERIKNLREEHGMTQAELGLICGVSDKAISTWENDKNIPRMGAIQKMADYFHISKGAIVEGYSEQIDELAEKMQDKAIHAFKDRNGNVQSLTICYYEHNVILSLNGETDDFCKIFFKLNETGRKEVLLEMLKRYC